MRISLVLPVLLAAALPLATTPSAYGKGATSVTVSGPGIDHVILDYTRSRDDIDLGTLSQASGIDGIFDGSRFTTRPDLSRAELGPRYVLRWDAGEPMALSYVYPFADGGAWAETPPGQEVWDLELAGGWWRGGKALERQLVELGADPAVAAVDPSAGKDSVLAGSAALPAGEPTVRSIPSGSEVKLTSIGLAVLAAVALVTGGVGWLRRRRGTLEPWPHRQGRLDS